MSRYGKVQANPPPWCCLPWGPARQFVNNQNTCIWVRHWEIIVSLDILIDPSCLSWVSLWVQEWPFAWLAVLVKIIFLRLTVNLYLLTKWTWERKKIFEKLKFILWSVTENVIRVWFGFVVGFFGVFFLIFFPTYTWSAFEIMKKGKENVMYF